MQETPYYLVQPRNQAFVEGRASKPIGGGISISGILLALLISVGIMAFGFFFASSAQESANFHANLNAVGIDGWGTVTNKIVDSDDDSTDYYLYFSYTVGPNQYNKREDVNRDVYNSYQVNQRIPIRYSDSNPNQVRVGHGQVDAVNIANTGRIVGVIVLVAGIVIGVIGILWIFNSSERFRLLVKDGTLVTGTVSRWTEDSDGDVTLYFTFQTPEGEIKTSHSFSGNSIKAEKQIGKTAYILYKSRRNYRLM